MLIIGRIGTGELRDAEDFARLSLSVDLPDHVWVEPDELRRLAGERANHPTWSAGFEAMLAFAARHGWVNDDGAVRVHVDYTGPVAAATGKDVK